MYHSFPASVANPDCNKKRWKNYSTTINFTISRRETIKNKKSAIQSYSKIFIVDIMYYTCQVVIILILKNINSVVIAIYITL